MIWKFLVLFNYAPFGIWLGRKLPPYKDFVVFTWSPRPGQSLGGFSFEPYLGSFFFETSLPLFPSFG